MRPQAALSSPPAHCREAGSSFSTRSARQPLSCTDAQIIILHTWKSAMRARAASGRRRTLRFDMIEDESRRRRVIRAPILRLPGGVPTPLLRLRPAHRPTSAFEFGPRPVPRTASINLGWAAAAGPWRASTLEVQPHLGARQQLAASMRAGGGACSQEQLPAACSCHATRRSATRTQHALRGASPGLEAAARLTRRRSKNALIPVDTVFHGFDGACDDS